METASKATQSGSTLLEFPGVSRASRPQWRKELSERVREIQERRSREAVREMEEAAQRQIEQPVLESAVPQLGLVPQPDAPAMNPIVVAALKRLERARQSSPPMPRTRSSMGGAAAAAIARVAEEQYEAETDPASAQATATAAGVVATPAPQTRPVEQPREHSLIIVPAQPAPKVQPPTPKPQQKRAIPEIEDSAPAARSEEEFTEVDEEALYDDRARILPRVAGSFIDLLVVAFASSPFAAIIELTNGNWNDWRVGASMGGIVLVVMFLYLTAATALAGRTWGMSLVSLRAVDADTGLPPTTKQAVGRAILYIASLITLGLGILYALFNAEGRTIHDLLSGTAVVRE
ncbi:MAG TPA: RDD family protein [Pyrinomonadaceae bacterium]|nr:RDD family protein [Pyrinomonadaceae bacterium]